MRKNGVVAGMMAACVMVGVSLAVNADGGSVVTPNPVLKSGASMPVKYGLNGSKAQSVVLKVVNSSGKTVRVLKSGNMKPGQKVAYWNGKDDSGKLVPPGDYTIVLSGAATPVLDKSFGADGVLAGFLEPKDVFVASNGDIYVLDKGDGWIYKIDPSANKKEELAELGDSGNVRMVAVDANGGLWYTDGSHGIKGPNGVVGGYDSKDSNHSTYWACGLALGPGNKIYIRNYAGRGLRVFDRTKTGLDGFLYGVTDSGYLEIAPDSANIAVDGKGDIWGTGHTNQLRKLFDDGSKIVFKYALGNKGAKLGQFNKPKGLCYAGDGVLYVADWGNNRVVKVVDDGGSMKAVWQFGAKGNDPAKGLFGPPVDVAVSGDAMFVLTDGKNASLIKYKMNAPVIAKTKIAVK